VRSNASKLTYTHKAGVLDICFSDNVHIYSAGIDRCVKSFETNTNQENILGVHEKPVKCIEYSTETDTIISGSWDKTIKIWDIRTSKQCVGTYPQPDKVYTMAVGGYRLIVGTCSRHVSIYDLRHMSELPQQRRESSLKYQTRCIRCFPDNTGYALSSIEGRVAVEYFDPAPEVQALKYAFKCHRQTINKVDTVYPVNAIAFHPGYGTFATGGCDGYVSIWDGQNKKRLCQSHPYPTSIASLDFNCDGSLLAIASSYTFEEGEKDTAPDQIFIRTVTDFEVKPKQRQPLPGSVQSGNQQM